ncbi:MAG: GNAT family N-acetyltransferase [Aquihabitans sp.]
MEAARRAGPADAGTIALLAREGVAELRPNRGGQIWSLREAHAEPIEPVVDSFLDGSDDRRFAVMGTIDDTPVGYALMTIETLHDGALVAMVSDLYVDPGARRVGVGEAMMDLLIAEATAAGAIGIDALALPGDRDTKNFFETFGLTARALLVHRALPGGQAS